MGNSDSKHQYGDRMKKVVKNSFAEFFFKFAVQYSDSANTLDSFEMYWSIRRFRFTWNLYGMKTVYSDVSWELKYFVSVGHWDVKESFQCQPVFDDGLRVVSISFEVKNEEFFK